MSSPSQQHHPERDQGKNAEPLSEEDQQQQQHHHHHHQQHTNRRPSRRDEKQYQEVAAAGEQLPENKRKREEGKAPSSTAASLPEENNDNNEKHRRRPSSAESSKSLVRRQSLRSVPKPEDVTEEEQGPSSSATNNTSKKNSNNKNKKKSTSPIRTNSPEDRTYVVKQDDLPPDQQYWASSNCNPFKSESGEKEKERQQRQHQNSDMTGATQQRNNTSSSLVPYQEEQKQPEKVNSLADPNKKMTVFEFSMPPQSKEHAQQQLKRSMPGAVVVSSSHHPLQNKRSAVALSPFAAKNPKKVQKYRKNPNSPGAYRSDNEQNRHQQDHDHDDQVDEQQQQVDDELGNFVKIPPIKTTKGGIASKMRNANVLRQMKPEVLHVGQDYYYNSDENEEEQHENRKNTTTNKKNQVGVHQPDTLERKAIDLLVVHDHTNKGRGGGGGGGSNVVAENHFQRDQKIAIISPPKEPQSQQQQAFGSSSLNNSSHSRRLLALERSREQQIKEKFNASRRQNEAMPGYLLLSQGNGRTASSIPPLIRTVAEEARNAEIVVYEKYDREFATRKLEAIAMKNNRNGGNNNNKTDSPLRHPETSRVYPMKVKPPEGFSSTEDAIVNLAKQHEAKRFYGMINNNHNHNLQEHDVDGIKNNRRDHNNNNNRHPFFIDNELNPQVRNNHYNLNHKVLMTSTNTNTNMKNRGGEGGGQSPSSQSQSQSYTSPTSNTARFASTTISNQNLHNPAHALTSTNNIQSKHSDSTFNSVVQLNSNNNNGAELGSSSAAAFASSKNNKKGHFATVPSSELRSMDSLMGIAVSHKKLSEAVRGLERCSNAANQYYYSSSATSSGRRNFTSPLHRDQNMVSSSSSARNANVVPPKPVFPRSYVRHQQTIMNNNNPLSQHTHSVYPNMKEQDVSSWLQSKYNNSNHTNSSSSSPPGTLLLQERQQQQQMSTNTNANNDDDDDAEMKNGALIIAYQKDAKKMNCENYEHHQLVTIPSSYPGGSDRVVKISGRGGRSSGAVGGDFSLLSSSASSPSALDGEDVNSLPSALPSISQGTPMKFSELMQKRLKEAERTAIPLN